MEVILDCTRFTDRPSSHAYLKAQFGFPDHYGANLDALYDCLTELSHCQVTLLNPSALYEHGNYGGAVLDTLRDAARTNPGLDISAVNCN